MFHRLWAGLLCAALLAGCTVPFRSAPKEEEAPPPPSPPAAAPVPEPFTILLPSQDLTMKVEVQDHGADPILIEEVWLRDEAQRALIATYAGSPYVRWEWNDEGLWRLDPKGGGAMLRYLPPTLTDGAVWKQESGDQVVWFHLYKEALDCQVPPGDSADFWHVAVLNRGEKLTFTFAPGVGPVAANAENYVKRSLSFTKKTVAMEPSKLPPEQRGGFIAQMKPPGKPAAAVQEATLDQFQAALAEVEPKKLSDKEKLDEVMALIKAGKGAELAAQVGTKGLHVHPYAPKGYDDWKGVTGDPLNKAFRALFDGSQAKVTAYNLSGFEVDLVVSGVNQVEVPSFYDSPLAVTGLISLKFRQATDGSWSLVALGVDQGYLKEVLQGGYYTKVE